MTCTSTWKSLHLPLPLPPLLIPLLLPLLLLEPPLLALPSLGGLRLTVTSSCLREIRFSSFNSPSRTLRPSEGFCPTLSCRERGSTSSVIERNTYGEGPPRPAIVCGVCVCSVSLELGRERWTWPATGGGVWGALLPISVPHTFETSSCYRNGYRNC